MTISGNISVPSVNYEQLTLRVSGTAALNYATDFANALNAANASFTLLISDLDTQLPAPGSAGNTDEYTVTSTGETGTIANGGAYLLDVAPGGSTVTGSGAGDTVLAAGGGMTYLDQGGNNNILFVSGNNTYAGSGASLTQEADTITAGSGRDSISTGPGSATVFSGTGHATITLHDTGAAGASVPGGTVVLNDGTNTVNAYGANDLISASAPGQNINGGQNAADTDVVVIAAGVAGIAGNDTINADNANFTLSDAVGNNVIRGGTGLLTVIADPAAPGTTLNDTVAAATGAADIFGAANNDFVLTSAAVIGQADLFIAGTGSETIDGSATHNEMIVFGNDSGSVLVATGTNLAIFVGGQNTVGGTLNQTIEVGTGQLQIFGGSGDNTRLTDGQGNTGILYVAGADNETIQASAIGSPLTVFGGQGGSLAITTGDGSLLFVGGSSYAETPSVSIAAGTGGANIFGNNGDVISLTSAVQNTSVFLAGAGNETLDGSGFTGNFVAYGYNPADPIAGGNVNESVVGGSQANYFFTGAGYETFVAGSGSNAFQIDKTVDGIGGTITIYNYNSADPISFSGYTAAQEQSAISSATASTDGIVGTQITLSDQTTVLFVDVSTSDLTFKT